MKKILCIGFVLFLTMNAKAQLSAGIKLGTNFASVMESGSGVHVSTSSRTAFNLGGYVNVSLSEKFKLQPELLYQGMGGVIEGATFKNDYVTVPVLLQYDVVHNFALELGPQIGFLTSSKVEGQSIKSAFNSTDVQLLVGASVGLTDKIGIGARYGTSLTNVASDAFSSAKTDIKNKNFSIQVSYKLF